jgi:hypothetical protein
MSCNCSVRSRQPVKKVVGVGSADPPHRTRPARGVLCAAQLLACIRSAADGVAPGRTATSVAYRDGDGEGPGPRGTDRHTRGGRRPTRPSCMPQWDGGLKSVRMVHSRLASVCARQSRPAPALLAKRHRPPAFTTQFSRLRAVMSSRNIAVRSLPAWAPRASLEGAVGVNAPPLPSTTARACAGGRRGLAKVCSGQRRCIRALLTVGGAIPYATAQQGVPSAYRLDRRAWRPTG